ncbi:MAG: glycosyltransferase [bacterium]
MGDNVIWFRPPRSLLGFLAEKNFKGLFGSLFKNPALERIELLKDVEILCFRPRGVYPLPQHLLPRNILITLKRNFLKQIEFLPKLDFILLGWAVFQEEIQLLRTLFPQAKIILDVPDDIPSFYVNNIFLQNSFFETLREVDGVVSINKGILEKYQRWIKVPSTVIPNGVSFGDPPGFAIKNARIKILGYFGAFDFWFDFKSLQTLASKLPDFQFFLAGPCTRSCIPELKEALKLTNIKYFGALPFSEIPDFLKKIDLLIIPWLQTEISLMADPIKIKEALYAGLPVISFFPTGDPKIDSKIVITKDLDEIANVCQKPFLQDLLTRKKWADEISKEFPWTKQLKKLREFCQSL